MRPLAERLAARGCSCMLVDWPGFGESMPGSLAMDLGSIMISLVISQPLLYRRERRLWQRDMPCARDRPGRVVARVLLAPTWRGPLPTAMGERPRVYAWVRSLVDTPAIGEALYRFNTLRSVIGLMYCRHVYAEASLITPAFIAEKQHLARRPGARFASVAFVTGQLDPIPDRGRFLALFDPPPVPTLVFCGNATPPRSKAEMAVLAERSGIDLRWMPGSLGLHEECAPAIADPIVRFIDASPTALARRQRRELPSA